MTSGFQIGDLVVYKVEYKDAEGVVRGKPRPLVIISEPNSKGDYRTIVGSTKIHQWFQEKHILLTPNIVLGGSLDKPTIFPASKQILIDSKFVCAQIGRIPVEYLETLLRQCFSQYTKAFFQGVHAPKIESPFIPGKSRVPYAGRVYDEKEMINLVNSSLDFWLTTGRYAERFERDFADFLGVKHAFLVNSGSSANLLAFMSLTSPLLEERQIRRGDEVITVAAGFPTTVAPMIQYGAVPVFVDVDLETANIDATLLKNALSEKTKAVMLAHTLGNPFDIQAVKTFCQEHNLWLIEDNCDALGATYTPSQLSAFRFEPSADNASTQISTPNTRPTGTFGDIATSSFYPAHHMTMGEGGAVYTNDKFLKKILLSMRDWGRDCWCASGKDNTCGKRFLGQHGTLPYGYDHKYVYSHFGYNLKVTDMQAAIGCAQLEKLPGFIERRKGNFQFLYDNLKNLQEYFILPKATPNSDPSWFGFLITLRDGLSFKRNNIVTCLEEKNIQTRSLFAGNLIRHPCFSALKKGKDYRIASQLKNTDKLMNDSFWIGLYPGMTEERIGYIVAQIRDFANIRFASSQPSKPAAFLEST